MASRRLSNGRSPLVRKQSQITAFFTPGKSPKPSPNPNPTPDPSPSSAKKKTPLPIPAPPSLSPRPITPPKEALAGEVVGRRIRVFWPLDKTWYDGFIKSFDELSGKHVVQYDDAEEELLDLREEKIELLESEAPRSFRRLKRMSDARRGDKEEETPINSRRLRRARAAEMIAPVMEEEEEVSGGGDNSTDDEDWGKGEEKGDVDDDSEEEMELVEEEKEDEQEDGGATKARRGRASSCSGSRKRKETGAGKLDFSKKSRLEEGGKKSASAPPKLGGSSTFGLFCGKQLIDAFESSLTGDAAERFGRREAEKFSFLGEKRKDAQGKRPGDPDYDPRTVYLPQDFLRGLSGGQRQWWEFKSKHMDKVLFFKMGKFYELFEMDAHIGVKELDLQYMKGEQPHCGFPEKNFSMNLEKLASKGYRVLVIEQTETPEQLELRRKEMGSKDKVVKREICAMVTKGTLTEGEALLTFPDASYLMSITENSQTCDNQSDKCTILGVCIVDASTSKFLVGQFEDDSERHCLCSILSELRPVEIIKPAKSLSAETERALKIHTRNPLVNELIPFQEFWDAKKTIAEIKKVCKQAMQQSVSGSLNNENDSLSADASDMCNGTESLPDVLSELLSAEENGCYALSALGGCVFYLRQAFLDVALLKCAKFEVLPCEGFLNSLQKPYMILDSAALENLEVLENNKTGGPSGTLFAQLDHCATSFGKRLLKGWLARPLYNTRLIIERQDAIAGLKGMGQASALEFRKELCRLPDMERLLARLFSSCEYNGRNASRVILYEDAAKKQLREFISALRGCQAMLQACSSLSNGLSSAASSLLHRLLTPGKDLPDVGSILKHFKDAFDWSEAECSGRIIPHEGADIEYDTACKAVKEFESCLTGYLKEQRKVLGDASINYVNVGKDLYLLEIPESLSGTLPRDYELRSSRKGYFRYWTPKIKKWLLELCQAEAEKESKLKSIMQRLIGHFTEHHSNWRQLVSAIAELDVLISLAIASEYYEGPTCRPIIMDVSHANERLPFLSAKSLGHPVLRSDALGKGSFVPNDITIGGKGHPSFILITGPNMGGKSTLLRQVCMAVILAQIGADVPAECFELSPVDRIFVRMGAKDHIMAGQSTFLVELSETASMLASATQNSLVALDELGRGTSTSDGQAIAASVLDYFIHKIKCRGLFSTHYHRLAVDYENDAEVSLCHMACQVGKGISDVEEVTFLYRLTPGSCPKSYGVNVARLAGIPASVLHKAMTKSYEFENVYGKYEHKSEGKFGSFSRNDKEAITRYLCNVVEAWNHSEDSRAIDWSLLVEVQQRTRLLVMGN